MTLHYEWLVFRSLTKNLLKSCKSQNVAELIYKIILNNCKLSLTVTFEKKNRKKNKLKYFFWNYLKSV